MSRIGKKPIPLPAGVDVSIDSRIVSVKGPKGELSYTHNPEVSVAKGDGKLVVTRNNDENQSRALHGMTRALIANMVHGVSEGFEKHLDLVGIGYTVEKKGDNIILNLGYSHSFFFQPPTGIDFDVQNRNTTLFIRGIEKQVVGQVAAKIRSLRKPEPYKGKGVKYHDEIIIRKAGKTVGG